MLVNVASTLDIDKEVQIGQMMYWLETPRKETEIEQNSEC
jgi:hypothetical protein